ncbi:hypothetical protein E2C01_001891 [Portunus trituberculatus]|uniref:Uncharacterized protein n=1 Tax=Portunus trituberculatus TaxID=210409 RepID=A0A5B7CJ33_PORTR|nr:hypothetical protein [Portunus trituberculatus]
MSSDNWQIQGVVATKPSHKVILGRRMSFIHTDAIISASAVGFKYKLLEPLLVVSTPANDATLYYFTPVHSHPTLQEATECLTSHLTEVSGWGKANSGMFNASKHNSLIYEVDITFQSIANEAYICSTTSTSIPDLAGKFDSLARRCSDEPLTQTLRCISVWVPRRADLPFSPRHQTTTHCTKNTNVKVTYALLEDVRTDATSPGDPQTEDNKSPTIDTGTVVVWTRYLNLQEGNCEVVPKRGHNLPSAVEAGSIRHGVAWTGEDS